MTTYYKITNAQECHNHFQYVDGLNILKEPFQPEGSCVAGGFYFSDKENIHKFLVFGCTLREITIPDDAQMVKDQGNDKWRVDRIIFGDKYELFNIETLKKFPFLCKGTYLTEWAVENNNLEMIKYIRENGGEWTSRAAD